MSSRNGKAALCVQNEALSIVLATDRGLEILGLVDRATGHDFVSSAGNARSGLPAFRFAATEGYAPLQDVEYGHSGMADFAVSDIRAGHRFAEIRLRGIRLPLEATFAIVLDESRPQGRWRLTLKHRWPGPRSIHVVYPALESLVLPGDPACVTGCVPMEIGTVRELHGDDRLGMKAGRTLGLPPGMNFLEFASLFAPGGRGGLYCACPDGWPHPVHLQATRRSIAGRWSDFDVPADACVNLPEIVVGVQSSGDWRDAIAVSIPASLKPQGEVEALPQSWIRDCGALYACSGEGAGGIYQTLPTVSLKDRIGHFDELPRLLDEAEQLGTNVIYLYDYWEGACEGGRPPYWNKGDYAAREDMGGEAAFKRGIERLHERGARVIVYLEPFIVYRYSELGKTKARDWAACDPNGTPYAHYVDNYTMCVPHPPWREHVVKLACRLVRDWDVDGIYLDSTGWQWNWPARAPESGRLYAPHEWNRGMVELVAHVRRAIREIKRDAVVLTESTCAPLMPHVDGCLDASFAWHHDVNRGRILASPARFAFPGLNFFSNGRNLNQLNQVFAAGHGLALSYHALRDAAHVRTLVTARQKLRDALVYGRQSYQPPTGDPEVAAYYYAGLEHTVIAVVNTSSTPYHGRLSLDGADENSSRRSRTKSSWGSTTATRSCRTCTASISAPGSAGSSTRTKG